MRLTTIVLAGITATMAVAGSAVAQEGTHFSGAAALRGIAPFLYDREDSTIERAYQSVLRREPTSSELRRYRTLVRDNNWSQSDIERDLRDHPDYQRNSGNRRGSSTSPDAIVRRAYQDILGRDPDPEGMRTYRSNIIDRGWSEQDVREALRKSPERREQRTGQRNLSDAEAADVVRRAYRSVLNRDPDANGMRDYKARVMNDRWTEQQVVNALRNSDEYRSKR